MAVRAVGVKKPELRLLQQKLDHLIESSTRGASKRDHLFADRGYIADLFNQTELIYWVVREVEGGSTQANIEADAIGIRDELSKTTPKRKASETGCLRFGFRDELVLWNGGGTHPSHGALAIPAALRAVDDKEAH